MSTKQTPREVMAHFEQAALTAPVRAFLEATLPYPSIDCLRAARTLYIDYLAITPISADDIGIIDNYIATFSDTSIAEPPTKQYKQSHGYFNALQTISKAVSAPQKQAALTLYQRLCGCSPGASYSFSRNVYNDHLVHTRDAIVLVIRDDEHEQLMTAAALTAALNAKRQALINAVSPNETQHKIKVPADKLKTWHELHTGKRSLGIKERDRASLSSWKVTRDLEKQMDRVDSEHVFSTRRLPEALYVNDLDLPPDPPPQRKTIPFNDMHETADTRLTKAEFGAVTALLAFDDEHVASLIEQVANDQSPPQLQPLLTKKPQILGAQPYAIYPVLVSLDNHCAKANNPSTAARGIHSVQVMIGWVLALESLDADLACLCVLCWCSGLDPTRLDSLVATDSNDDIRFDAIEGALHYSVLNHRARHLNAAGSSERTHPFTLPLPKRIVQALERYIANGKPLSKRYRKLIRTLRKQNVFVTSYLAQWAASQPGIAGPMLRPMDQSILAGRIPTPYTSDSAYTQSTVIDLQVAFGQILDSVSQQAAEFGACEESILRQLAVQTPPDSRAWTGSDYTEDLQKYSALQAMIRKTHRALARKIGNAPYNQKLHLATSLANLINLQYYLVILASTIARPHWGVLSIIELTDGLYIQDKNSSKHMEFRAIQPFEAQTWSAGQSLLQRQRKEAHSAHAVFRRVVRTLGYTLERPRGKKAKPQPANPFRPYVYRYDIRAQTYSIELMTQKNFDQIVQSLLGLSPEQIPRHNLPRYVLANLRPESDSALLACDTNLNQQRNLQGRTQSGLGIFGAHSSYGLGHGNEPAVIARILETLTLDLIKLPEGAGGLA